MAVSVKLAAELCNGFPLEFRNACGIISKHEVACKRQRDCRNFIKSVELFCKPRELFRSRNLALVNSVCDYCFFVT